MYILEETVSYILYKIRNKKRKVLGKIILGPGAHTHSFPDLLIEFVISIEKNVAIL